MSPSMSTAMEANGEADQPGQEIRYQKGVKHLCDSGITSIPNKYVFPPSDRPGLSGDDTPSANTNLKLPVVDFAHLKGPNRSHALKTLAKACEDYGFFQLKNHGIPREVILNMIEASKGFFELPFEERSKYMSADMYAPVRYGTSFNQNKDRVFCWRDFLKLSCQQPLSAVLPFWPSSPAHFRQSAMEYSKQAKSLYLDLTEAILESLGLVETAGKNKEENDNLKEFQDGSQLIVVNCYPSCPEPDLTLGMPPHSDYGFLTLLLQDEQVKGLQIHHHQKWLTVDPIPDSFVVNVGDHLEIFSNGRYKSVLHRVLVNPRSSRISIASLHSLQAVRPAPELIDEDNPRRYKDTTFASFLDYISSCEPKSKNFLESRKLT